MLLAERPDLQVLMLKRNEHSAFVGDMWLFPGGAVDPDDAADAAYASVEGIDDEQASRHLDLEADGLAYWVAAVRETFEEAGVLLARRHGEDQAIDLAAPDVAESFDNHRRALNTQTAEFLHFIRAEKLWLAAGDMSYVSRWITPRGAVRRYDTRFFVAAMPSRQVPMHDNDEAVHHEWMGAADALQANAADEMLMVTPTVAMLQRLAQFGSVDEALAAAARGSAAHDEVVRIRKHIWGPDRLAFPDHADYHAADARLEDGVVRWPLERGSS
jgi:8-oxo-dGTP pyrophosphatase MutT (NUDIX family)